MCFDQAQQILFVWSIHATCFGHTDHPQALKHMILKLKNLKYIPNVFSVSKSRV